MATISIKIDLEPSEYDLIVDSLVYHASDIADELANPISNINDSDSLRQMSSDKVEEIEKLLAVIYARKEQSDG